MRHSDLWRRFWVKVRIGRDCWEWRAARNRGGYGMFWDGAKMVRAHRFAYELELGPIPYGLVIDHLCRNRACVRPDHLEAVTLGENIRRGEPANRTHCPYGHPYDEENTVHRRGKRECKKCNAARQTRWRSENRDHVRAYMREYMRQRRA